MLNAPRGDPGPRECYIVPARMLRGSRADMLAQIEEAVQALMALRLVVLASAAAAHSSSTTKR